MNQPPVSGTGEHPAAQNTHPLPDETHAARAAGEHAARVEEYARRPVREVGRAGTGSARRPDGTIQPPSAGPGTLIFGVDHGQVTVSGDAKLDPGTAERRIAHLLRQAVTAARQYRQSRRPEEEPPDGHAGEPAPAYHETATGLRRTLAEAAEGWSKASERYLGLTHAQPPGETPAAVRDAYVGALMAYGYSYTLAAVLGVAEREFGPEVAERLASDADEILTNGDFDDLNTDVTPAPRETS